MGLRFTMPISQWINSLGSPLAGGKLYFYASGTSTPLSTYSDSALTIPNTNPVIADSTGVWDDIYLQAADYKVDLKTSAGIQVPGFPVDPVSGAVSSSNNSYLLAATGAATRTVSSKLSDLVSVKDFGATGDGVTDDYAALAACVTYVRGQGQGIMYLPFGTYINNTQVLDISGVSVWGASDIGSIIKRGATMSDAYTVKLDGATVGGAARMSYRNFLIDGNSSGNSNANVALLLKGNVIDNVFETLQIQNSKTGGMKLILASATRPNVNSFTNIQIISGSGYGMEIAAGTNMKFVNLDIEIMAGIALNISGADEAPGNLSFENFDIENSGDGNIDAVVVAGNADTVSFIQGNIQDYGKSDGTIGNGINVSSGRRVTIDGVDITPRAGSSVATHRKIVLGASGGANVIKNMNYVSADIEDNSTGTIYSNCNLGYHQINVFNGTAIAAAETWYFGPGSGTGSATQTKRRATWIGRGVLDSIKCECSTLPGGAEQYSIWFVKNATPSALLANLTNANGGIDNQTTTVSITDNDNWSIKVVASAGAVTLPVGELHITLGVRK